MLLTSDQIFCSHKKMPARYCTNTRHKCDILTAVQLCNIFILTIYFKIIIFVFQIISLILSFKILL